MMILSLRQVAEDFTRFFHASIVDQRNFQDVYYLGNVYRIRIKHLRKDPELTRRMSFARRKPKAPRDNPEVSKCVTCGGPSVGPVCMYKACAIVTNDPPRPRI